jgi:hypothetical protein
MKRSAPGKGGSGFGGGSVDEPAGRRRKAGRLDANGNSAIVESAESPPPAGGASSTSVPGIAGSKRDSADDDDKDKIEKSADIKDALREAEAPTAESALGFDAVNGPGDELVIVLADAFDDREEQARGTYQFDMTQEPLIVDGLMFQKDASNERTTHAKRVLHPGLLLLATGNLNKQASTEVRENKIADVLVTILLDDVSDAAVRDALSKAGLSIKGWSKSLPIVVGTVAVEDLEKLANIAGVRRIEPTRMTRERVARPSER